MNDFREEIRGKLRHHVPRRIEAPDRTPAAVLIPFFEKDGEPHLLFTKRTDLVQHHRGEICFPGGVKEDSDPDLLRTALRELEEEISVPENNVEVLGSLDELETVASNFVVVPYVGYIGGGVRFYANQEEVEQLLEIPFSHFKDPAIFREDTRIIDQQSYRVYYYQWQSHTTWGVTGRIVKSLLDLLL